MITDSIFALSAHSFQKQSLFNGIYPAYQFRPLPNRYPAQNSLQKWLLNCFNQTTAIPSIYQPIGSQLKLEHYSLVCHFSAP